MEAYQRTPSTAYNMNPLQLLGLGYYLRLDCSLLHLRQLRIVYGTTGWRLGVVASLHPIHLSAARLSEQIGPHGSDNILREQIAARHQTFGRSFDSQPKMNRYGPRSLRPSANIRCMGADGLAQGSEPSAFAREVSFQVHVTHYSDSLTECNSESHIDGLSVLL